MDLPVVALPFRNELTHCVRSVPIILCKVVSLDLIDAFLLLRMISLAHKMRIHTCSTADHGAHGRNMELSNAR